MVENLLAWLKGLALKLIRQKPARSDSYVSSHMKWELLPYHFKLDWYVRGSQFPGHSPDRREADEGARPERPDSEVHS